jgi:hypothetical protein
VGIPIGWKSSVGGMISSDDSSHMSPWYMGLLSLKPTGAWYTVNGDDYLGRGHAADGLEEKLRNYLQGQVGSIAPISSNTDLGRVSTLKSTHTRTSSLPRNSLATLPTQSRYGTSTPPPKNSKPSS